MKFITPIVLGGGGGMDWMLDFEPNLECGVLGGQP